MLSAWLAVLAVFLLPCWAQAAPEERSVLSGSIENLPDQIAATARAVPQELLADTMEIEIPLRMRNYQKLLDRIAARNPVPQVEMERDYLPLAADYDAVRQWLEGEGFVVTSTDPNRLAVFASGTVAQIQKSMQVEMVRVTKDGRDYHAARTSPSLPKRLATPIIGINGLQPYRKLIKRQGMLTQTVTTPYHVNDILGAYNATGLGLTGSGQTIAILIDGVANSSDLSAFWSANGVTRTGTITNINVNNITLPAASGEETLDESWSSGIAPGADLRVYAAGNLSFTNLDKSLVRIINDLPSQPTMHILSISLGLGETYLGTSEMQTESQYFATLANSGVSVFVSSGDGGSNPTSTGGSGGTTAMVEYEASDPNVTSVGGTSLSLDTSGAVTSETAWSGSGGGTSTYFARPSWQTGPGVPSGTKRLVPDVSLDANPNTGVYLVLNGSSTSMWGGTSLSAPVWAGFCALLNQSRANAGNASIGLLNPYIYPLSGTSNFRDVTSGSNGTYSAGAGYDEVTGLGVPNVAALISTLSGTPYTISTASSPSNGGTTSGGGTYYGGGTATVTASANSGYVFSNWTVGGTVVSTSASYSFTVTANTALVANFTAVVWTVSTASSPANGGTTSGAGTYNDGATATVVATPNSGYVFANWTVGGSVVSTSPSYSFTVGGNTALVANFIVPSTVSTLSSLSLASVTLSPAFASGITGYTSSVANAVTSTVVTPTVTDSTATIKVNGTSVSSGTASQTIPLTGGANVITIVVTAQDGVTTTTYTVVVTRQALAAAFTSATTVPVSAPSYNATGSTVNLSLGFAPATGTNLTVIHITGLGFIQGQFSNLAQGQAVTLTYNNYSYHFVANYYGGAGYDLVLQWANNKAYAWGLNSSGQLGNNTFTNSSVPSAVITSGALSGKTIVAISAGSSHSLALCQDGTIVAWGSNNYGQLGNNSTTNSSVPVTVTTSAALTGKTVVAVSAGGLHSLALCQDGSIVSWGYNNYGQLGNNSTTNSSVPVAVTTSAALTGKSVVSISAGSSHNLALCSDGTVVSWGYNNYGQLGNRTSTNSSVPVSVSTSSTSALNGKSVVSISAGNNHSLALCSNGSLAAWGYGSYGQLGNNSTSRSTNSTPVSVVTSSGALNGKSVVSIATGGYHCLALCSDGSLASWGYNNHGQLGNASTSNAKVAVSATLSGVLSGHNIASIAGCSYQSLALCADGLLADWGYNTNGQLGNNGTADSSVPVTVSTSTLGVGETFTSLADGPNASHVLALAAVPFSGNSSLSGLALSSGLLSPAFGSGITSYTATVSNGVTSVTVTPTVSDSSAVVTVAGVPVASGTASAAVSLNLGANPITITVTAQNGTTTTYTVTVTRTLSSVSTLSALSLDSGSLSPSFAPGTTSYTATVGNATTSMTVTPTLTDSMATVRVNGTTVVSGTASAPIPLSVGGNVINIVATAQDGVTTSTYTITVTRAPSSVSALSALSLDSGPLSPSFSPGISSYGSSVANAIATASVTPTAADNTAIVRVNGSLVISGTASAPIPLAVGNNVISVVCTAQDGVTTSTYVITVARAPSSVSTLSSLALSSGSFSPSFSPGTTGYTATVGNATTSVSVTPTPTDSTATVRVNGTTVVSGTASAPIPLAVGNNVISVVCTAQDGVTTSTYVITVARAPSSVSTLSALALSSGPFSPSFSPGTTGYTATVGNTTTSVTVTPTPTDSTATVRVNGTTVVSGTASAPIPLSLGGNVIHIVATAQDGATTSAYTITVTRAPSSVSTLSSLALDSGPLSPSFSPGISSYGSSVPNAIATASVTPTAADNTAIVRVNGSLVISGTASAPIPLAVGNNVISVVCTAQDGVTTSTYVITVARAPSSVSTLSALALSSGPFSPSFSPGTTGYAATVGNATTSVTVTPTVADGTAFVRVNGLVVMSGTASAPIPLSVGNNAITVVSTAQDGVTTSTYTITVSRAPSSVSLLSALSLDSGTLNPSFTPDTTVYTVGVGNAIQSVVVTPTPADTTAVVRVNGAVVASGAPSAPIPISVGGNVITITATAQDGVTASTYTITVTRALSAVSTLSALALDSTSISPSFDPVIASYVASVANSTTSVAVTATPADATATVAVNGAAVSSGTASLPIPLPMGNSLITVVVTAQDGVTTSAYTITVTRAASSVSTLSALSLDSGTLSPAFSPEITSYTATVADSITSVSVTPSATDSTATITLNGNVLSSGAASAPLTLSAGDNTITLDVTAQDGVTRTNYSINIHCNPYALWKASVFTNPADLGNPAVSGDLATPSHDGITNLMKYALGIHPMDCGVNDLPVLSEQDGFLALTYRQNKLATDVVFTVQVSDSLNGDNWTPVTSVVSRTDCGSYWLVTVQDDVPTEGNPRRFMRLQVGR